MNFETVYRDEFPDLELAENYIQREIYTDAYFKHFFAQVLKHLRILKVSDNELHNSNLTKIKDSIEVTIPSRLGINQRATIVKKIRRHGFCYEVRLDDTYSHCRIIFFVHEINASTCAFSFGFTKRENEANSDKTDLSVDSTYSIYKEVVIQGEKQKWLR